jgi:hypothetical protein
MTLLRQIIEKFNDGGPFFMYTLLVLLILVLGLFIKALIEKNNYNKTISLLSSIGWFAVAWGFLGRTFGLIVAFDNVSAYGELTVDLLAAGLKMALLNPLFALMVFLVARAEIIILQIFNKETT